MRSDPQGLLHRRTPRIVISAVQNPEIPKKERKLVDVWKKRVDAEMKVSGEAKPESGHGISRTYKQSPAELVHPPTKIGSGGVVPEVGVKSSGTFAGNAKVTLNGIWGCSSCQVSEQTSGQ